MAPSHGSFTYVSSPLRTYMGGGIVFLVAAGAASTVFMNIKHASEYFFKASLGRLLSRLGLVWQDRVTMEKRSIRMVSSSGFDSFLLLKAKILLKLSLVEPTHQQHMRGPVAPDYVKQLLTIELETLMSLSKSLHDDKAQAETQAAALSKEMSKQTRNHLLELDAISFCMASMSGDFNTLKSDAARLAQHLQKQEKKTLVCIRQRDEWRSAYHQALERDGNACLERDIALQKVKDLETALEDSNSACNMKDQTILQLRQREAIAVQVFSHEHSKHEVMKMHASDTIQRDLAEHKQKNEKDRKEYKLIYSKLASAESYCQKLELESASQAAAATAQRQVSASLRTKKRSTERKLASQRKKCAIGEKQHIEFQQATRLKVAEFEQHLAFVESTRTTASNELNNLKASLTLATERCKAVEHERNSVVTSLGLTETALESSRQAHVTAQQELKTVLRARDGALDRVQLAEQIRSQLLSKVSVLERDLEHRAGLNKTCQDELSRLRLVAGRSVHFESELEIAQRDILDLETTLNLRDAEVDRLENDLAQKTREVTELSSKLSEAQQNSGTDRETMMQLQASKLALDLKLEDVQKTVGLEKSELLDEFKVAFKDLGEELWAMCQSDQPPSSHCSKFSTKLFDDMDMLPRTVEDTSKIFQELQIRNSSCAPANLPAIQASTLNAAAAPFTFPLVSLSEAVTAPFHHQLPNFVSLNSAQPCLVEPESSQGWLVPSQFGTKSITPLNDPAIVSYGPLATSKRSSAIKHYTSSSEESNTTAAQYGSNRSFSHRRSSSLEMPESSEESISIKKNMLASFKSGMMASRYADQPASQAVPSVAFGNRAKRGEHRRRRGNKQPVDPLTKRCFTCGGLGHIAATCGDGMV